MKKDIYVTRSSMPSYEEYCEYIRPLWESRWLTNMGKYHEELEEKLAGFLDVPKVSLTVNGHMALELTIQAFGFPEGAEVITTPFTFISTTHAIVRNRLKPVFCDVRESDGTIDSTKIENLITEKTVAIVPVHVYGNPCDVTGIEAVARKYDLKVIYDAAHAFGVKINGIGIANYGNASAFSFHATKLFHTIEGGAVACLNDQLYEQLYNLKNFGIRDEELVVSVGANAKMNEFSAAMGLLNLRRVQQTIEARKCCIETYMEKLGDIDAIRFLRPQEDERKIDQNYAYCPIVIQDNDKNMRNKVYDALKNEGIYSRKYFYPLTADQACFKNKYREIEIPLARAISEQVLVLPLFEELTEEEQIRICNIIKRVIHTS